MEGLIQKKGNGLNKVGALMTGAIVGAGVAVAGAAILKDEKNREKVLGYIGGIKKKIEVKKTESKATKKLRKQK